MSTTPVPPPEPPPMPSGSQPKFLQSVKKNPMMWVVVLRTGFIMYSSFHINSATANANEFGKVVPASGNHRGAQLSGNPGADEKAQLEAAIKLLAAQNEDLKNKLAQGNQPPPPQYGSPQAGVPQLTAAQQMAQQIAADRQQAQYKSLWASPILAAGSRTQPSPDVEAAERRASEQGITGTLGDGSRAQQPAQTATDVDPNKEKFSYDDSVGPYHIIPRGTVIGGTLVNDLNSQTGESVATSREVMKRKRFLQLAFQSTPRSEWKTHA